MIKKLFSVFFTILVVFSCVLSASALEIRDANLEINAKSAVLMDAATKTVLYSKNMNDSLPPASVTKIMTLLLIFETIESGKLKYSDVLTVSENAASMGGSQVFLEPGEQMSVDELLKCVTVASANDAAVTLAEHVGGSVESFVSLMNKRAKELGMKNTHFENPTGLDDSAVSHLTSAYDIAIMSSELLKHEKVCEYATIWMDTIRNGEFGLSNTNKLVRYYNGITGLKTGSTNKAGFCVSASAKRNGLHLVAVIMGAETSAIRNQCATKLLDFGFANYSSYVDKGTDLGEIRVLRGEKKSVKLEYKDFSTLENLGNNDRIKKEIQLSDAVTAPIKMGDTVGKIIYSIGDKIVGENDIICKETVEEISFWKYLLEVVKNFILN